MLKLNNVMFNIKECYLDAYEDDGQLEIGLNITAFESDFMEYSYAPKIESEILFSIYKGNPKCWKNDLLKKIRFKSTFNEDDDPNGILYLGEHLPIENLQFEITHKNNSEWLLSLEGSVQCRLKGDVAEQIKISLEHDLCFKCIWLGKELDKNWENELKDIVSLDDFKLVKDENNVFQLKYNQL